MARWSIPNDGLVIDITETPKRFEHDRIFIDLELFSEAHGAKFEGDQDCRVDKVISDKVQCLFDQFLIEFLKEMHAHNSFRPIPPMLGNGQPVNLKTLFLVVIGKGGYDVVSKKNLWNLVAEKFGLGLNIGSSAKLIYSKYLGTLETWLINVSEGKVLGCSLMDGAINFDRQLMTGLQAKIKRLLSEWCKLFDTNGVESKVQDSTFVGLDMSRNSFNIDDTKTLKEFDRMKITAKKLVNALDIGDSSNNNRVNNVPNLSNRGKGFDNDDDVLILDPSTVKKENYGRKRKRKSMQEMLCWVTSIAKNPRDLIACPILERSKWSSQSNEEVKKQVLLFREAVFVKRNFESSKEHNDWQGIKMHPCMYEDHSRTTCNVKERLKCENRRLSCEKSISIVPVSSKISIGTLSDSKNTQSPLIDHKDQVEKTTLLSFDKCSKITVPLGPSHQALVPEWTGVIFESDPKWLGTQIWPSKSVNHHRQVIQRDPSGKGRNDFCNCQVPGSVECLKFHIVENRDKIKLELDVAFYQWNFHKVGEQVSHHWTYEEEKKFKNALRANLQSRKKCHWDHIFRSYPKKKREDLVSYYFNVFVLRRRRQQNQYSPNNIDSDDDGLESEPPIKAKAIRSVVMKK
ncbi:AT-rich interactive domain-containing protein 1-like [Prosopis cineraria]|uniref:AT-rich interactive domain-containing protein 1-like n=1 Tax=Prosopis cineraria TaxID=364024 RepID=UPI002410982E|nr:AT-rich interactive domain-containing protein 1-like [Prosopis cineraria]